MSRKHQGNGLQEQQNRATTLVFHEQWHEGAQCGYHSLYTLCKNHCSNLEESCMITQFTGKIIKSLVSFLFHYIACSLQCFLYEPEAGSPAWLCARARQSSPIRSACAYTISETRWLDPGMKVLHNHRRTNVINGTGFCQEALPETFRRNIYSDFTEAGLKILNHIKCETN